MRRFSIPLPIVRPIAALLLAVSLHACMKWSVVTEPKTLASSPRENVRITTVGDARHFIVKNPTVSGDSILWTDPERGGLPLNEVMWVEARSLDPVATGFIVLVGVAFLGAVVLRQ
jgi:hypothetical protein